MLKRVSRTNTPFKTLLFSFPLSFSSFEKELFLQPNFICSDQFQHCCASPYFPKFLDTKRFSFCFIFLMRPLNLAMCYSIHTVQGVFSKNILRRRVSSSEQVCELIKETRRSTSTIWHAKNKETIILLKWTFLSFKDSYFILLWGKLIWNWKCFSKPFQIKKPIKITRWILKRSNSTSWQYNSKFYWINQCYAKFCPRSAKQSESLRTKCLPGKGSPHKATMDSSPGMDLHHLLLWSTLNTWIYLRANISSVSTFLD